MHTRPNMNSPTTQNANPIQMEKRLYASSIAPPPHTIRTKERAQCIKKQKQNAKGSWEYFVLRSSRKHVELTQRIVYKMKIGRNEMRCEFMLRF